MKRIILNSRESAGVNDPIHLNNFKLLAIVFALLFILAPAAWGQEIEWIRQFGSMGPEDDVAEVVDANGNIYIAGRTDGTLLGQTSAGGYDAFVCKYDSAGNWLWTRQFGTGSNDYGWGIAVDGSGVYVSGYTLGTLGQTSAGLIDAFVRKYDLNGTEEPLWTIQFGTESNDYGTRISVDATGVYVTGYTYGTLGQSSAGLIDAFVRKYDLTGTEEPLWTSQFGTASDDYAYGISVDAKGVYVSGFSKISIGEHDAFVCKYNNADGTEQWTHQFGTEFEDRSYGISVDATGVYVSGYTKGSLPDQINVGGYDAFVCKYDSAGNWLWNRQFGTTSDDCAFGISVDPTGVHVAGYTKGTLTDPSNAGLDAFVRKYDHAGGIWTSQFGTEGSDKACGVSVHATGVYVVGYTDGTFEDQSSAGGKDAFVVKLIPPSPVVIAITIDSPIPVNTPIVASADFTDPDVSDPHTAEWDWGDGSTSEGTIDEAGGSGTVTGDHPYNTVGVYTVKLTVKDADDYSGISIYQYVVVYDPNAGYVTGAGWIDSPAGAYTPDPSLTGKAKFGFVSKYKKGQSTPDGNTQFNFKTAKLKFQSTSYDWLVIAGPHAKYKGSGTIKGEDDDYGFMLTAVDGQIVGGGGIDKFRIKIWNKATEEVVYDNQLDDPDDGEATDAIEGGKIVIRQEGGLPKVGDFAEDMEQPEAKPDQFTLFQNYPNPFNPETMIRFQIPQADHVTVRIFNTLGAEIRKVVNGRYEAGDYTVIWDARDHSGKAVSSGTYIYQIQAGQFVDVKRMVLIR